MNFDETYPHIADWITTRNSISISRDQRRVLRRLSIRGKHRRGAMKQPRGISGRAASATLLDITRR